MVNVARSQESQKLRIALWLYCKKDDIGKNSFRGVFEEASWSVGWMAGGKWRVRGIEGMWRSRSLAVQRRKVGS